MLIFLRNLLLYIFLSITADLQSAKIRTVVVVPEGRQA